MRRGLARALARWLVGVLLLSQFLLSAYACPSWSVAADSPAGAADAVVAAETLDDGAAHERCVDAGIGAERSASALCNEHCKSGQQSDAPVVPGVPVPVASLLYVHAPPSAPPRRPAAAPPDALLAATPPHAILHCVRRT